MSSQASGQFSTQQRAELGSLLRELDRLERALRGPATTPFTPAKATGGLIAYGPSRPGSINGPPPTEQVVNGGLEAPVIAEGAFSQRNDVDSWSNTNADGIEIWRNVNGYTPAEGQQWAELDNGGLVDQYEVSVNTTPGQMYNLSFAYSARPGVSGPGNEFELYFDGQLLDTIAPDGIGLGNTDWRIRQVQVRASGATSTVGFRETASDGFGALLDAVSLTESDLPPSAAGQSTDNALYLGSYTNLSEELIVAGSIVIDGVSIAIDPSRDSLQDVIDAINFSDSGATARLVSEGDSSLDDGEIFRFELTGELPVMTLDDGGTGFLDALGIASGSYGNPVELEPIVRERAADRRRSYVAADALGNIRESFETIFGEASNAASGALRSSLDAVFAAMEDRHGEGRLRRLGLDLDSASEGFLSIDDRQARRRFVGAVQDRDDRLLRIMLDRYVPGEDGLIDALRDLLKAQLRESTGSTVGSVIDRFA